MKSGTKPSCHRHLSWAAKAKPWAKARRAAVARVASIKTVRVAFTKPRQSELYWMLIHILHRVITMYCISLHCYSHVMRWHPVTVMVVANRGGWPPRHIRAAARPNMPLDPTKTAETMRRLGRPLLVKQVSAIIFYQIINLPGGQPLVNH